MNCLLNNTEHQKLIMRGGKKFRDGKKKYSKYIFIFTLGWGKIYFVSAPLQHVVCLSNVCVRMRERESLHHNCSHQQRRMLYLTNRWQRHRQQPPQTSMKQSSQSRETDIKLKTHLFLLSAIELQGSHKQSGAVSCSDKNRLLQPKIHFLWLLPHITLKWLAFGCLLFYFFYLPTNG